MSKVKKISGILFLLINSLLVTGSEAPEINKLTSHAKAHDSDISREKSVKAVEEWVLVVEG